MPQAYDALDTVDLIYRAAIEPHLWPEALERFSHSVGCIGMAMIPITPNDTTGLIVSPSMREVEEDYMRGWWRHDTRVARIFDRRLAKGVFCEPQLFEEEELTRDPFRQDFCRKHGIGAFAVQLIEPLPGQVVAFSGQRGLKRGHFEQDEIAGLGWIGRHAARALTISLKLAAADSVVSGLMGIFDRFDGGVFILNARGEVTRMNARAERMLGDGVTVRGRMLTAVGADRQRALNLLIASALERWKEPSIPISLPRQGAKKPLIVQAIPLSARRAIDELADPMFGPRGALVLAIDPGAGVAVSRTCLRLLGLTAAEARLAALIGSGLRRRSAAEVLGISEWNARDTLKNVYAKLGIGSLAELVRLVDSVAAIERTIAPDA